MLDPWIRRPAEVVECALFIVAIRGTAGART
jgi:hypothetical protein